MKDKRAYIESLFVRKRISLTSIPVVEPIVLLPINASAPTAKKTRGRPSKKRKQEEEVKNLEPPESATVAAESGLTTATAPESTSIVGEEALCPVDDSPDLPLNSHGLSLRLKLKCADIGQEFIKRLKALQSVVFESVDGLGDLGTSLSSSSSPSRTLSKQQMQLLKTFLASLAQASLQLLVHITREATIREYFSRLSGAASLLSLRQMFEGMTAVVFTLLQHQLEEPQYLQSTMETTIRLCWTRMQSQHTERMKLLLLLEVVAPLLYRNQTIFMQAFSNVCGIETWDTQTGARTGPGKSICEHSSI
jgi:hypothetical protein